MNQNDPKSECLSCRLAPMLKSWGCHTQKWQCDQYPPEFSNGVALSLDCPQALPQIRLPLPGQEHPFPHLLPQNTRAHTQSPQVCIFISVFFWWPVLPAHVFARYLRMDNTYLHPPVPHSTYLLSKPAPLPGRIRPLQFPHLGHSRFCQGLLLHSLLYLLPHLNSQWPFSKPDFTSHFNRWGPCLHHLPLHSRLPLKHRKEHHIPLC